MTELDNIWNLSCEEEPVGGQLKITRTSPEAVQIARGEELEFMDKLAVLKEVPVEPCWSETNTKPVGTKWIDIKKGDGEQVEIRSRHVATELNVHLVKMGILRGNVFSATPLLEAVRLLMSLMMTRSKQASQVILSRARFHSTS